MSWVLTTVVMLNSLVISLDEFINHQGGLRIKSGVGFITKKIFWIEYDGPGNAHSFFHATAYFSRKFFICIF